jgi:hypothetical protein
MGRKLENLSFEEWVKYVFDHPLTDPKWYFLDSDYWDEEENSVLTLNYLTRLFENPLPYIAPYTHKQINDGLWFLNNPACSGHLCLLANPQISWDIRKCCIMAMKDLFEKLFATLCTPHLSYISERIPGKGRSRINEICYMWWDIMPVAGHVVGQPEIDAAFFEVMEFSLTLNSDACRESALHGLNHYQFDEYTTVRCQSIIDTFLATTPNLRPELVTYAKGAREGMWQ